MINTSILATRVNLCKQPYSGVSSLSRLDTDYYPSDAVPVNRKDVIQMEVIIRLKMILLT